MTEQTQPDYGIAELQDAVFTASIEWIMDFLYGEPVQRTLEPGCKLEHVPMLIGPHSTCVDLINSIRSSTFAPGQDVKHWLVTGVDPLRGQNTLFKQVSHTLFALTHDLAGYSHKQFQALRQVLADTRFYRQDGDIPFQHVLLCYASESPYKPGAFAGMPFVFADADSGFVAAAGVDAVGNGLAHCILAQGVDQGGFGLAL